MTARPEFGGDYRLAGQWVAVVGASRGIGAETAVACAQAGAEQLLLLGRDEQALADVAARVEAAGASAKVARVDVRDASALARFFSDLPRLDTLIYSAGVNRPEPFVEVSEQVLDLLLETNVRGAFLTLQAAARHMLAAERAGTLILVGSQMGHVGARLRTAYCATKHAVEGLVKAAAVELGPAGIRVVSVAPTFVRTELTAAQLDDPEISRELLAQIPLGRFGSVAEVAQTIAFLASPAAGLITGSSVRVDGGWTAR